MKEESSHAIVKKSMILRCNGVGIIHVEQFDHEHEEACQEYKCILVRRRIPVVEIRARNHENALEIESKE